MSLAPEQVILEFERVAFTYQRDHDFIKDLTFSIANGEFIGLLGANGSGKSTILKLASGILAPSHGSIKLWGKPLQSYKNKDKAKLLCYLPQLLDINIPFKVWELVGMGLYPYDILPEMTVTESLEKRRAFLAMTLLQGAGLVLLDEPLANLDIKYQIEIMRLLRELQDKKHISVIMALHDINMAFQFERVMVIKDGRIAGMGNPEIVLSEDLIKEAFDVSVDMKRHGSVFMK